MKISKISIIGAGLMGSGIAQVVAKYGFKVTLFSRKGNSGLYRLTQGVSKAVIRKILSEEEAKLLLSHVTCTSSVAEAVLEADLIIEAVNEDLDVKRSVFRELDTISRKHTILASNTSSLDISSLAEVTKRPDKVIGMHFFNPAPIMNSELKSFLHLRLLMKQLIQLFHFRKLSVKCLW